MPYDTPHLGRAATEAHQTARSLAAENVNLAFKDQQPRTPLNIF